MKNILVRILLGLVAVVGVIGGVAALLPVSAQLDSFHRRLPLPIACVGLSCLSYRDLAEDLERAPDATLLDLLTRRLEERALSLVAFREGIRVSDTDIARAVAATEGAVAGAPNGNAVLKDLYGPAWKSSLASAFQTLLLREKLHAEGIPSPWSATPVPTVTVWNVHLRWDPTAHRVVEKSLVAGDANVR